MFLYIHSKTLLLKMGLNSKMISSDFIYFYFEKSIICFLVQWFMTGVKKSGVKRTSKCKENMKILQDRLPTLERLAGLTFYLPTPAQKNHHNLFFFSRLLKKKSNSKPDSSSNIKPQYKTPYHWTTTAGGLISFDSLISWVLWMSSYIVQICE